MRLNYSYLARESQAGIKGKKRTRRFFTDLGERSPQLGLVGLVGLVRPTPPSPPNSRRLGQLRQLRQLRPRRPPALSSPLLVLASRVARRASTTLAYAAAPQCRCSAAVGGLGVPGALHLRPTPRRTALPALGLALVRRLFGPPFAPSFARAPLALIYAPPGGSACQGAFVPSVIGLARPELKGVRCGMRNPPVSPRSGTLALEFASLARWLCTAASHLQSRHIEALGTRSSRKGDEHEPCSPRRGLATPHTPVPDAPPRHRSHARKPTQRPREATRSRFCPQVLRLEERRGGGIARTGARACRRTRVSALGSNPQLLCHVLSNHV